MKTPEVDSPRVATNERDCEALLDSVVQQFQEGRHRHDINLELVRQNWNRSAARQFCDLALKICHELKSLPQHRTACAKRGFEGLQAGFGWIGFGVCGGAMLYFMGDNTRSMSGYAIIPVLYGVVELISGLMLYWPHRDFLKPEGESISSRSR